MFFYREVSEHEVGDLKREMAGELIPHACQELDLTPPKVQWFVTSDLKSATFKHDRDLFGAVRGNSEILLRADRDIEQTGETILHELRHLLQFKQYPTTRHDSDELVASEFGVKGRNHHIVQRYVNLARNRANSYSRMTVGR